MAEGYDPKEMPLHETGFSGPLAEPPGTVHASGLLSHAARAHTGDRVWVCVSVIKAGRRDDFSRFVRETVGPAARAVTPEAHASVRFLEPLAPSADGTWSFVWLMDPVLPGEDYEVGPMLEAHYGMAKGGEHLKYWEDCHVGEQLFYEVRQAEW